VHHSAAEDVDGHRTSSGLSWYFIRRPLRNVASEIWSPRSRAMLTMADQ